MDLNATPHCEQVWDALSAYADGEAGSSETALVEAHLRHCPDCSRELQLMRMTAVSMASVPEVEPPAYLRAAILAATVEKKSWLHRLGLIPADGRGGMRKLALAGAAVTCGVVLA